MSTRASIWYREPIHLYRETLDDHIYLEVEPRTWGLRWLYTDRQVWPPTLRRSRTGY